MITTALITGASSGIGAACAEALADRGVHLCVTARRDDRLRALCRKLNDRYGAEVAFHVAGDVTDSRTRLKILDEALSRWDRLDVLVNNAGSALAGAVEEIDLADVRRQFEVNTFSALAWMQLVGPVMRRQQRGRIINISSISGRVALPVLGAYAASKFAMEAFSDAARVEYRPWGISVCLVEPGAIATEIWDKSRHDLESSLPNWAQSPFREFYQAELRHVEQMIQGQAPGPRVVAKAVCHAAEARRPKARYRVTLEPKVLNLLAHCPTRLRDWVIRRLYGIGRKRPDLPFMPEPSSRDNSRTTRQPAGDKPGAVGPDATAGKRDQRDMARP